MGKIYCTPFSLFSRRNFPTNLKIKPLYDQLLAEENKHTNRKTGLEAGVALLRNMLKEQNMEYDEFIAAL